MCVCVCVCVQVCVYSEINTDAIFILKQMQKNFRVEGKKLYFGFVDLEKAFDRVPIEVIRWELKNSQYQQSCLCMQVQKQLPEQFMVAVNVLR